VFRGSWANLRNLRETSAHCGTGNDGDNEVEDKVMKTPTWKIYKTESEVVLRRT
jgi:hypothetical protein